MRACIEQAGFRLKAWEDVTEELAALSSPPNPASTIQALVADHALPTITESGRRNRVEGRIVVVQAVLEKA